MKETVNEIVSKNEDLLYKVHEAMPESIAAAREGKVKLIYIHRDLKDVAASFMVRLSKTLQQVLDEGFISNAYRDYNAWTSVDGILVQEYHKVIADRHTAIREIGNFLGIQLPEAEVKMLAEKFSLENQKKLINNMPGSSKQAKLIRKTRRKIANTLYSFIGKKRTQILAKPFGKIGVSHWDPDTCLLSDHINTGEVGSYKKVMSAKDISKMESYLKQLKAKNAGEVTLA